MCRYVLIQLLVFGVVSVHKGTTTIASCRGNHCKNNTCVEGTCPLGCVPGFYDKMCRSPCSPGCVDSRCEEIGSSQGHCIEGCLAGFWGGTCTKQCSQACRTCDRRRGHICTSCKSGSYYGDSCNISCFRKCEDTGCRQDGICRKRCPEGFYDKDCVRPCSIYCRCPGSGGNCVRTCHQTNGTCKHGCEEGHYDEKCEMSCGGNCLDGNCDAVSGRCLNCKAGFYGSHCVYPCTNCKYDVCDQETGECSVECKDGFHGATCNTRCRRECPYRRCNRVSGKCVIYEGYTTESSALATDGHQHTLLAIIGTGVLLLCSVISGILLIKCCKSPCCSERIGYLHPTPLEVNHSLPEVETHEYTEINDNIYSVDNDSAVHGSIDKGSTAPAGVCSSVQPEASGYSKPRKAWLLDVASSPMEARDTADQIVDEGVGLASVVTVGSALVSEKTILKTDSPPDEDVKSKRMDSFSKHMTNPNMHSVLLPERPMVSRKLSLLSMEDTSC